MQKLSCRPIIILNGHQGCVKWGWRSKPVYKLCKNILYCLDRLPLGQSSRIIYIV